MFNNLFILFILLFLFIIYSLFFQTNNNIEKFNLEISLYSPDKNNNKILSLAEIKVYDTSGNELILKNARQSSTDYNGIASRAIDNDISGNFHDYTVTKTKSSKNPKFIVSLPNSIKVEQIGAIYILNRTDIHTSRLNNAMVKLYDKNNKLIKNFGSTGLWNSIYSKEWNKNNKNNKKWNIIEKEKINENNTKVKFSLNDYKIKTS